MLRVENSKVADSCASCGSPDAHTISCGYFGELAEDYEYPAGPCECLAAKWLRDWVQPYEPCGDCVDIHDLHRECGGTKADPVPGYEWCECPSERDDSDEYAGCDIHAQGYAAWGRR